MDDSQEESRQSEASAVPEETTAQPDATGLPTVADEIAALQAQVEDAVAANHHAAALPYLTRWLELAPDDPEPLLLRAWEHRWSGDRAAARADIEQAEARWPQSARVAVEAGELYGELEAYEEEETALNRAAPLIADDDADLLLRLADDYEEAELYEKALAVYERLQKVDPYGALRGSSRVRRELGDPAGALRDLDAALAALPADLEARNMILGWMYSDRAAIQQELQDLAGAEASARRVLDLTEDPMLTSMAQATLADLARQRGDLATARSLAEAALARDPKDYGAWQVLITAALDERDVHGILDTLHRALEQLPTHHEWVTMSAMMQAQLGNIEGILGEWTHLIEAAPEDASARAMRGTLALGFGRTDLARADADQALRLDPSNSLALETRARLLLQDRNAPGALAAVNLALESEPDNAALLVLRGETQMALQNPLASAADFARAVALDPDNYQAQAGMGHVQMVLGNYDGALQSYQTALRLAPEAGGALYNVAAAYAQLGRCAQCVTYLRRAILTKPELVEDAQEDEFMDPCRSSPGFEAALRGEAAPTPGGKGKKGKPQGRPPRGQRK